MNAPAPTELLNELIAFFNFINEPPQYEDQRMVRDYRHELARLWMPLHEKINAAIRQAASVGAEVAGAAVGYVSPLTLKALLDDPAGAGPIVACAGYDTTIPLYASPSRSEGVSQGEVQSGDAVKLTYIKRWRTIVPLPAKHADEIAEALRPSEPEAFQYRFQDDDGKWNGWFVCEKEQYDRVCRNGKIGHCKAEARPLYATSQSAPAAQASLDRDGAAIAASAICDYADNNVSMFDACCDEVPAKATEIYETAKRLRDLLAPSVPSAECK